MIANPLRSAFAISHLPARELQNGAILVGEHDRAHTAADRKPRAGRDVDAGNVIPLADEIPVRYEVLEANQVSGKTSKGGLTKVSRKGAEARLETPVPDLSNLKMRLIGSGGKEIPGTLYGKVLGAVPGSSTGFSIRFTSVSPEIETLLRGLTASVAGADEAGAPRAAPSSKLST